NVLIINFFYQAEDGIRYRNVTGVQTCALPISISTIHKYAALIDLQLFAAYLCIVLIGANLGFLYHNFYPAKIYMGDTGSNFLGRSEERRVGKECNTKSCSEI